MNTDIESLDGPSPLDRLIDQGDAKLFRCQTTLLFLEKTPGVSLSYKSPTPVLDEEGTTVGYASVYRDGKRLIADMVLDYHSEIRLMTDNEERVYAHPEYDGTPENRVVSRVVLDRRAPADDRLSPISRVTI